MRFLRLVYNDICENRGSDSLVPDQSEFANYIDAVELDDEQFNTKTLPPGSSGESGLFNILKASMEGEIDTPLFDR